MTNEGVFGVPRIRSRGPFITSDDSDEEPSQAELDQFRWRNDLPEFFSDQEVLALMQIESNMVLGYVVSVAEQIKEDEGSVNLERVVWSEPVESYATELDSLDELEKARAKLR